MNFMLDHGTTIWTILAVVGLIAWVLLGLAGLFTISRIFLCTPSDGKPGAYVSAAFAALGLAASMVVLLAAYFVLIGGLSVILFPS
jgi:hypothetical protein